MTRFADGAVIGSEIVKRFANDEEAKTRGYLQSIRKALDENKTTAQS